MLRWPLIRTIFSGRAFINCTVAISFKKIGALFDEARKNAPTILNFDEFEAYMPSPGEGTLKNRMLYFKDNLKAKTGTLSDTSAIAGYITTRKGKTYTFDIMINDAKTSPADKKNIEEQILRNVYVNY